MDHPYRQIELQAYELCDKWRYQRLSLVGEHLCVLPLIIEASYYAQKRLSQRLPCASSFVQPIGFSHRRKQLQRLALTNGF